MPTCSRIARNKRATDEPPPVVDYDINQLPSSSADGIRSRSEQVDNRRLFYQLGNAPRKNEGDVPQEEVAAR
jgi:hypothetical protein